MTDHASDNTPAGGFTRPKTSPMVSSGSDRRPSKTPRISTWTIIWAYTKKFRKPILLVICLVVLLFVFKGIIKNMFGPRSDKALIEMKAKLDLLEQQRQDEIKSREQLLQQLNERDTRIAALQTADSLRGIEYARITEKIIPAINKRYDEKKTVIEHYNSTDLELFYRNLPDPDKDDY